VLEVEKHLQADAAEKAKDALEAANIETLAPAPGKPVTTRGRK
jgi:hypothetical protein